MKQETKKDDQAKSVSVTPLIKHKYIYENKHQQIVIVCDDQSFEMIRIILFNKQFQNTIKMNNILIKVKHQSEEKSEDKISNKSNKLMNCIICLLDSINERQKELLQGISSGIKNQQASKVTGSEQKQKIMSSKNQPDNIIDQRNNGSQQLLELKLTAQKLLLLYMSKKQINIEDLSKEEIQKRITQILKQKEYLNLKTEKINEKTVFTKALNQSQVKDRISAVKLIQKYSDFQEQKWNELSKNFSNFLIKYFQSLKKYSNIYPPKFQLKYVLYNQKTQKFYVNPQSIILWTQGMIQQPLSLQQVLVNSQTPNGQIVGDPLIYFADNNRKEQEEKDKTLISLIQSTLGDNFLKNWTEFNQKQKALTDLVSQAQQISKKLNELWISKPNNTWKDLDEFVAIYNYLMLIYEFYNSFPFDIYKWKDLTNQNQGPDINKGIHEDIQNEKTLTYQKMEFICQCYANKQMYWKIFLLSLGSQQKRKEIQTLKPYQTRYLTFDQIEKTIFPKSAQELKAIYKKDYHALIKQRNILYLNLIRDISFPDSSLFLATHNAVRYILISLTTFLYEIDITNFQQLRQGGEVKILEFMEYISSIPQFKEVFQKLMTFKIKSFEKIIYYENNQQQMVQNSKVVRVKAKQFVSYIKDLHQKWQKMAFLQRFGQRQTIANKIHQFLIQFLYNRRTFKFKELQIKYQHRENLNQVKLPELKKFIVECILVNFSFMFLFNIRTISKFSCSYNEEEIKLRIAVLQIIGRTLQDKKLIDFQNIKNMTTQTITNQIPVLTLYCSNPILKKLKRPKFNGQNVQLQFFGIEIFAKILKIIQKDQRLKQHQTWQKISFIIKRIENNEYKQMIQKEQEENEKKIYSKDFLQSKRSLKSMQEDNNYKNNHFQRGENQDLGYDGGSEQQFQEEGQNRMGKRIGNKKERPQIEQVDTTSYNKQLKKLNSTILSMQNDIMNNNSVLFSVLQNALRYIMVALLSFFPKICQKNNVNIQDTSNTQKKLKKYYQIAMNKIKKIQLSTQQTAKQRVNRQILETQKRIVKKIQQFQKNLANPQENIQTFYMTQLITLVSKQLYKKQIFKNKQHHIHHIIKKKEAALQQQQQQLPIQRKSSIRKREILKFILGLVKLNYQILIVMFRLQNLKIIMKKQRSQKENINNFVNNIERLLQLIKKEEQSGKLYKAQDKDHTQHDFEGFNLILNEVFVLQKEYEQITKGLGFADSKVYFQKSEFYVVIQFIEKLQKKQDNQSSVIGFKLHSRLKLLLTQTRNQNYLMMQEWPKELKV